MRAIVLQKKEEGGQGILNLHNTPHLFAFSLPATLLAMVLVFATDELAIALALAADILVLLAIDIALDVLSWMLSMESVIDFFLFARELASSNFLL